MSRLSHSDYHRMIYNPRTLRKTISSVKDLVLKLKEKVLFDAIAFQGSSGSAIAFSVSAATQIPLILVRKEEEVSHGRKIEGTKKDIKRYIIIDDFICSGTTVQRILDKINDEADIHCVGIILYNPKLSSTERKFYKDGTHPRRKKIPVFIVKT